MLDQIKNSWQFVVVLGALSLVKIVLSHVLPADSKVTSVITKIVDFFSANVQH